MRPLAARMFVQSAVRWQLRHTSTIRGGRQSELAVFPRRALLYVPGNDLRKIEKTKSLSADCVVMDFEDGVAANKKMEARDTARRALVELDLGRSERAVRINSVSSSLADEDLAAVLVDIAMLPQTIVVPKVENEEEILWLCSTIKKYTLSAPLVNPLNIIIMVESANSLLRLRHLCQTVTDCIQKARISAQLCAVIFGSDDFCADIGASRSPQGTELLYARQKVIVVAKSFRLQAIDMVHIDFKDIEGLRKYSLEGAQMGFTGKQVIHPLQVPVVQEAFSPSDERVRWASELIAAFKDFQDSGKGSFVFRNQMIDKPLLLQAQNIKNLSDAIAFTST